MEFFQSMRVFVRLAESGSFTKVAEATQTGRPYITRSTQELGASLGGVCFSRRTTRKVNLTAEGQRFFTSGSRPAACRYPQRLFTAKLYRELENVYHSVP